MPRTKDSGKRVPLRKVKTSFSLNRGHWKELEEVLGTKLPDTTRGEIIEATQAYAEYGLRQSKQNSLPLAEITSAIEAWSKATQQLQKTLRVHQLSTFEDFESREEIIESWRGVSPDGLKKALPLEFLTYCANVANATASQVLLELAATAGPIRTDMWCAWVCLVANALKPQGIPFSAASRDKGEGSIFVKAVELLQATLPTECQMATGYDSIAKYVQRAKRSFGAASPSVLLGVIILWGGGRPLFDSSPLIKRGNVSKAVLGFRGFAWPYSSK